MTQTPDPEDAQAAIEYCYAQGWSDGLPLVPASQPLIDKFLATTSRTPGEVIGELEQVGRNCTVYLAAVNAAMAGCLPEYFPVVLAAFDALMRERAARGGGWQSTSGPAPLIVVNGPVRHELGFNAAGGERAGEIAATLAADGYPMEIAEAGRRVRVTITATPQACADCLVPQDMMRGILGQAFGVPRDAIDLTYPSTSEEER